MLASVHSGPYSNHALPVCLFTENPNRLVSLWDIVNLVNVPAMIVDALCCVDCQQTGKANYVVERLESECRKIA